MFLADVEEKNETNFMSVNFFRIRDYYTKWAVVLTTGNIKQKA